MTSRKKNSTNFWIWFAVILILVVVIILYVCTLGAVNVSNDGLAKEFKESKEDAIKRHALLKAEIFKKIALCKKLTRRFKIAYAITRVLLVLIWLIPLYILYTHGMITDVGGALDYSQGSLVVILILNFMTFGTLTNLDNFIAIVKTRVENFVWGKNITLPDQIQNDENDLLTLENQISL